MSCALCDAQRALFAPDLPAPALQWSLAQCSIWSCGACSSLSYTSYPPYLYIFVLKFSSRWYALRSYITVNAYPAGSSLAVLTVEEGSLPSYCSKMQRLPIHSISHQFPPSYYMQSLTAKKASDVTTLLFSELVTQLYVSRANPPRCG